MPLLYIPSSKERLDDMRSYTCMPSLTWDWL